MELVDLDDAVGPGDRVLPAAPLVDALPDEVRAGVGVQYRRLGVTRLTGVGDHRQRLVVDLDELGGVARELARLGHDDGDGVADEADASDGERVVLDRRGGRRRQLEEGVCEGRHLVAGEGAVDARQGKGGGDVDRADDRVGIGRAHEVRVAHVVATDVVDEGALTLEQPPVLLAREALAGVAAPLGRGLDLGLGG